MAMQAGGQYWNKRMETVSTREFHEVQERAVLKELDYVWSKSKFYQEKLLRISEHDKKRIDTFL